MPSLTAAAAAPAVLATDPFHSLDTPIGESVLSRFQAKVGHGAARGNEKQKRASAPRSFVLRDFQPTQRRATRLVDATPANDQAAANFHPQQAAGNEAISGRVDSRSHAPGEFGIERTADIPGRRPLSPSLFESLYTLEPAKPFLTSLAWRPTCLRSLAEPEVDPETPHPLTSSLAQTAVPEVALAGPGVAHAVPTVDVSRQGCPDEDIPLPGSGQGNKFYRALSTAAQALGRVCDMVYASVNTAGRGCRDGVFWVYGAFAGLVPKAAGSSADPAGAAVHRKFPASGSKASSLRGAASPVAGRDVLEMQLHTLKEAYANTAVMEQFMGSRLTERDLLYMVKPRAFRRELDAADLGMNGPDSVSGALMRGLTTAADNVKDPWRAVAAFGGDRDSDKYKSLRGEYLAELAARHPGFEQRRLRLRNFGDNRGIAELEDHIESARTDMSRRGMPGENIDIADLILLQATMSDPATGAPVAIDPRTGKSQVVGVTGRQLSADIPEMRRCLADMIAYLEELKSRL